MKKVKKTKAKEIVREIAIPEGVEASVNDSELTVKSKGKEVKKQFFKMKIDQKDSKVIIKSIGANKKQKKNINAIASHVKNMIKGMEEDYVYKLQICAVHFPMNISVQGDKLVIKNYLGETKERKAKILDNVKVSINKEIIEVTSPDKEAAGQTAGNIEKATQICDKDKRIFQDGIYLIQKAGVEL